MDSEDLRLAVYRAFAGTGRAPEHGELAAQLGASVQEVAAGLDELARGRHLALGDQGQIVMAHPFAAVPLGFSAMGARTLWWGSRHRGGRTSSHASNRRRGLAVQVSAAL